MNPPEAAPPPSVEMVYLYYDNPEMLRLQLECWSTYPGRMERLPAVTLIDDGSPRQPAVEVVRKHGCRIPLRLFRVREDIAWNFTGARNLGCHHSPDWIYVSDIDTMLYADDARLLFEGQPLQRGSFYMPRRVKLPDLEEVRPGIVNLLFHRSTYDEIGGYDEDYAGHYGREETDYYTRIRKVAPRIIRDDVLIRVMPHTIVADACTRKRVRDKTRNGALFESKEKQGFPRPVNPLRFTWDRVL